MSIGDLLRGGKVGFHTIAGFTGSKFFLISKIFLSFLMNSITWNWSPAR